MLVTLVADAIAEYEGAIERFVLDRPLTALALSFVLERSWRVGFSKEFVPRSNIAAYFGSGAPRCGYSGSTAGCEKAIHRPQRCQEGVHKRYTQETNCRSNTSIADNRSYQTQRKFKINR
jgi:hypothetical protein